MGRHLRPPRLVPRRRLPDRALLDLGPDYARIAEQVKAGTYKAGYEYFDADSKAMGLYGFMEGQTPQPGIADLPAEDVQMVKDTLAKMLAGEFSRFDVFAGPIKDNTGQGDRRRPAQKLEQADLDQFPPGAPGNDVQRVHALVGRGHQRPSCPSSPSRDARRGRARRSSDRRASDDAVIRR